MTTIELNGLIADGEFPKRSGSTLTGDGINDLAADVANVFHTYRSEAT